MELNPYEISSLKQIEKWEKAKHEGFHKKILDVVSNPVNSIVKAIGPEKLKTFEAAVDKTVRMLLDASTYTVDTKALIQRAHAHGIKIKDLSDLKTCDLELLDDCNRKHIKYHQKAGAIQGAAAGLGGALLAAADLTAILVEDFHMVQEIASCYAYDANDLIEKQIILRIIEAGIGGSDVKADALREIEALKAQEKEQQEREASKRGIATVGAKTLEDYIEHMTTVLLVRLIPRALPVISAAVSAHSNHEIIEHSGKAAFMVYRKKFIERKRDLQTFPTQ